MIAYIEEEDPDVFGLSEVEGALVYEAMTARMPGYAFSITEGRQSQEILVAVRHGLSAFFTQRNEFKRSNPYLRPGALLTLRDGDTHLPILFTHLKSMTSPEGFGLRDAMFGKVSNLKKKMDAGARARTGDRNARANLIVLGDMNTMGMNYHGTVDDIPAEQEIRAMTTKFGRYEMAVLPKSHPHTWYNGSNSRYEPSNLDHVIITQNLDIAPVDADGNVVAVKGWAEIDDDAAKDQWISDYSDHAPLTFTINGA